MGLAYAAADTEIIHKGNDKDFSRSPEKGTNYAGNIRDCRSP